MGSPWARGWWPPTVPDGELRPEERRRGRHEYGEGGESLETRLGCERPRRCRPRRPTAQRGVAGIHISTLVIVPPGGDPRRFLEWLRGARLGREQVRDLCARALLGLLAP
ncbi:hypothetical protein GA0115245_110828 [Streptomyces sp. di188]|nr:hypothetical protein GA0115245_110828 [Streptomyces sp. di188]SCD74297.1 hypothetical protein GA0115238_122727 [Streptomyces sp. di50b]